MNIFNIPLPQYSPVIHDQINETNSRVAINFSTQEMVSVFKKMRKVFFLWTIFLYLFIYKQPGNKNYNKFILRFSPQLLQKRFKKYFSILSKSFNDFAAS